ncbi:MAG: 3'-5' exonuclease, partial [Acidimicrobiales bacterium]
YQALHPARAPAPGGNSVVTIGMAHPAELDAEGLRTSEASDVANIICLAIQEKWQVSDSSAPTGWRPANLGDITILLPARTSLSTLERALDGADIAYRAETSSLVYSTGEVRDLMAVLRSVADPTDELALATALRSAVFGCGDDDLYTFHQQYNGKWNHQAPVPQSLPPDHPVGEAMHFLRELHEAQMWLAPSELIERIVRDRRILELAFANRRPRDLWRRFRFLTDQARAYAESEGGGLREYLAWAELQSAEGARVSEAVLPETDDDSVRIMTIHGAKGLEFPITILSGLTTQTQRKANGVQVLFPPQNTETESAAGWAIRVKKGLENREFERYGLLDEQLGFHETLRLLYVAATRASDHLVVSVHRKVRVKPVPQEKLSMSELFASVLDEAPPYEHLEPDPNAVDPPQLAASEALIDRTAWESELSNALANGTRRRVLAATTIARMADEAQADDPARDPGLAKDSRDLDLPPWQKGRYGTAIGRAVHGVLQTADLVNGVGLADVAAAQAAAEGVMGKEAVVEALSRSALETESVRQAVTGQYWREMYVAAPVADDLVVEGYIDLLYRTGDGLVVVDYKTDAVPDDATLEAKLARYRLQGATYALAVEEATGETVCRVIFAFLREDGSTEREVVDLRSAIEEVRSTAMMGTV